MLALLAVLTFVAAARSAWMVLRLWQALPRRNADFHLG